MILIRLAVFQRVTLPQNDNTQSDFSKLTSNKMATGSVTSSQAILARFLSPPDKPLTHMSPMTVKQNTSQYETGGGGGGLVPYFFSIVQVKL